MHAMTASRGIFHLGRRLLSGNVGHNKARLTEVLSDWTNKFQSVGIPDAASSAEYIIAHVLGKKTLHKVNTDEILLGHDDITAIDKLSQRRLERMPVQYVIGERDFDGMVLKVAPPVFIPRPETEELVGYCKEIVKSYEGLWKQRPVILEFGCGSGAITIALLKHFKELQAVCVDKLPEACLLTETNAENVGVKDRIRILNGDFTDDKMMSQIQALGPFSFIVSNPPYVTSEEMDDLAPEIYKYESLIALNGGSDGLELVRPILHQASNILMPYGHLFMEVGERHPRLVEEYVAKNKDLGLQFIRCIKDINEKDRFCHLEVFNKL